MNTTKFLVLCTPVVLSMAMASSAVGEWSDGLNSTVRDNATAADQASDAVNTLSQGVQTLQSNQGVLNTVPVAPMNSLTGLLMQRLNVSQMQAAGGAGALFQVAKSRMSEATFNQLSQAVPDLQNLLNAAPRMTPAPAGLSGLAPMTGVSSDTLSGLGALADSFQQLGMTGDRVQQFIPVLVDYVRSGSGGDPLANALMQAF
ncbi:MAG: DUF2780 domain-containing protein [Gammaproteobacteria bacterium]